LKKKRFFFILILLKASYLYCVLCHKHRDEEKLKDKWKQIWLKPVVEALDTSTPLHRFLIVEVKLFEIFIKYILKICFFKSIFYQKF
jgi:hypothetical protein